MEKKLVNIHKGVGGSRGFSLIELMIVVAILGILGVVVGVSINSAGSQLSSFVFNLGSRFKQARFEAMKRGHDVYMDFDMDGCTDPRNDNGYTMWVDNNDDGVYDDWTLLDDKVHGTIPKNGVCDDDEGKDCRIVPIPIVNDPTANPVELFPNEANAAVAHPGPELYDPTDATGGPAAGIGGEGIDKGFSPGVVRFAFHPNGDSSGGKIYVYFPRSGSGGKQVAAGPWAIDVSAVGRIRVSQWKSGTGWPAYK